MALSPLWVRDVVVDAFLDDGRDHTIKELAVSLGVTEAVCRRAVELLPGTEIRCSQEMRTSYSKSFRGMESGVHRVWVYGPTREYLRERLLAIRGAR